LRRNRETASVCITLVALAFACSSAAAQESYPNRPIQIVIPFPAGGSLDIGMRLIQQRLSDALGVPLILVNRPGASGVIGMSSVASAAPDGYTLGATSTSTLTVVQLGTPNLPYKISDFATIGNYAVDASTLIVRADSPWDGFDAFVSQARAHPGSLNYGSPGVGTLSSLNMAAIRDALNVDMIEVPYPGTPQVVVGVLGKQVHVGATSLSGVIGAVRDRTLRPLAVGGSKRLAPIPDTPTLSEKGLKDGGLNLTLGLYAPRATPAPVVDILQRALKAVANDQSVIVAIEKVGMFVQFGDGDALRQQLETEFRNVAYLGQKLKLAK
jgi:tripartite-type tricarboxylate transporter receptor subunit TctC